ICAGADVHLRPRKPRVLLPRLREADGPLGRSIAGSHSSGAVRGDGRGQRRRDPQVAKVLRPGIRGTVPALLRNEACNSNTERGDGAKARAQGRAGALGNLRKTPGAVEEGPGAGARAVSGIEVARGAGLLQPLSGRFRLRPEQAAVGARPGGGPT